MLKPQKLCILSLTLEFGTALEKNPSQAYDSCSLSLEVLREMALAC